MTPQYILTKSLCREPHCASGDWKPRAVDEIDNMRYSNAYAEQGYDTPKRGILFADWNYFPRNIDSILERAGYTVEWSDEWDTCGNCGKAVRTSPNCWDWQPGYVVADGGLTCTTCLVADAAGYLETLEDDPNNALNNSAIDPAQYGYVKLDGPFESGLHAGMNDKPDVIYTRLSDTGKTRLLFRIDETSQFYITFSVWQHESEYNL